MARGVYGWGENLDLNEPVLGGMPLAIAAGGRIQAPEGLFYAEGWLRGAVHQERVARLYSVPTSSGYLTADVHMGIRLPRGTSLALGLENLFDASYAHPVNAVDLSTGQRLNEPGRLLYLRLQYGF